MSGQDHGDAEFSAFEAAGQVEVGESNVAAPAAGDEKAGEGKEAKAPRRGPPKPAAAPAAKAKEGDDGDDGKAGKGAKEGDDGEAGDDDDDKGKKPGEEDDGEGEEDDDGKERKSRKPSERIRNLTQRLRAAERTNQSLTTALASRLDALEKGGLPKGQGAGKSGAEEVAAPDPTDVKKYPLGHLDDRYIEDKLEWLAEKKATARADAALHRQQETEMSQAQQAAQGALLEKVEDLATRGEELYDDYQESVVDAGMRGDWALSQPTFEAAHEVDNGAQILYELSQDKKEAKRVAGLSPFQQMKFVEERDAEIAKTKGGRKIPKAGAPPENQARGANSKTQINPATENLDDFEKAWIRDEKGKS